MTPRARRIAATVLAAAAFLPLARGPANAAEEKIEITSKPLPALAPLDPERTRFGKLIYLGGAELDADSHHFGGISSIDIAADGTTLTAVTDIGDWITARIATRPDGTPTLEDVVLEDMRDERGRPLTAKRWSDAEGVSAVPGSPGSFLVSFERHNRIWRYDTRSGGLTAKPREIPVPEAIGDLPENKGVEALAALPASSPLGEAVIAFAEAPRDGFLQGFIIGGKAPGAFRLRGLEDYDATDLALGPDGNLILLERYFSILTGPRMALQRIRIDEVKDGATIYPELLMEIDFALEIDNMEALAVHSDAQGRTIVTVMSDDNFFRPQRNLLLRFELVD